MRKQSGLPVKAGKAGAVKIKEKQGRDGVRTERNIIEISTPMFTQYGYDRVSTRMIADAAAITVPTIYLYFKNKRALYLRCCVEVFQQSSSSVSDALIQSGSAAERVFKATFNIVRQLTEDPHLAKLFQRELLDADSEGLALLDQLAFQDSFKLLRATVDEALGSEQNPYRTLAIYALSLGTTQYMQMDRVALANIYVKFDTAEDLAKTIFKTLFPEIYGDVF